MNFNFTINYGSAVSQTIEGKLNPKTLEEMQRCLDEAVELLKENRVGSITMCCSLEAEQEEK